MSGAQSAAVAPSGRPVVGLTAGNAQASWSDWTARTVLTPGTYVDSLVQAGAELVLIPPQGRVSEEIIDRLDALVLSGGPDLQPAHYAAAEHPLTDASDPERDRTELELVCLAVDRQMPILAICRGMEVLNVALGGSLVQHIPDRGGSRAHSRVPGQFTRHPVEISDRIKLPRLAGRTLTVASYHHQGVEDLGHDLVVVARAFDGTVEAVQHRRLPFAVGVLWHPEQDPAGRHCFEPLVEAAARYGRSESRTRGREQPPRALGLAR